MVNVISIWIAILIANIWFAVAQLIKDKRHFKTVCLVGVVWTTIAIVLGVAYRLGVTWLG